MLALFSIQTDNRGTPIAIIFVFFLIVFFFFAGIKLSHIGAERYTFYKRKRKDKIMMMLKV